MDVQLLVNLEDFDQLRGLICQAYQKFKDMKAVTATSLETQEYLLLLLLVAGEKIFGFRIDLNNFHKTRIDFLSQNKEKVNSNIYKNKKWSLVEIQNQQRVSTKKYLSFL